MLLKDSSAEMLLIYFTAFESSISPVCLRGQFVEEHLPVWIDECRLYVSGGADAISYVLTAHGADVLHITSPKLPALPLLDKETSRGKRNAQLDLTDPVDRSLLAKLCMDADVFLQGYRPGGMDEKGFSALELAKMRPGIVYASLNAYGWKGPWKDRRGVRVTLRLNWVAKAQHFR